MRRLVALSISVLLIGGCTPVRSRAPSPAAPTSVRVEPSPGSETSSTPAARSPGSSEPGGADVPAAGAPVPDGAAAVASDLVRTTMALRRAIERWVREGGTDAWPPPREVELWGLHQQVLYRALSASPELAGKVLGRLPAGVRAEARDDVAAGAAILSLARPVSHPRQALRTRPPEPAAVLLRDYREAERRFGVDWELLASVNFLESKFGRVVSPSWAGAQGPMQFLPSTWATYGLGGDVHDPRDAIMGAANYLHASGAPADERAAVHAYNPVPAYVTAILRYANAMRRDPRTYYAYYTWQVFVRTRHGAVRLTGPGRAWTGSR